MEDVDDDMDDEFPGREMGYSDSDVDEYDYLNSKAADTTAAQAREGKDIQGIPWDRLGITREKYRRTSDVEVSVSTTKSNLIGILFSLAKRMAKIQKKDLYIMSSEEMLEQ
ncbi:PREDICTED: WD repeat-containing [Prunus dulcis]|uniref:PREDICTED: WD repeat-containing n=1 Tax=Prunus dulcis TaxID=3755 RepID=A0A5E4GGL7_PRUDU|nr:PREDICTED: WD repeat-containing [Prunus dulcis]